MTRTSAATILSLAVAVACTPSPQDDELASSLAPAQAAKAPPVVDIVTREFSIAAPREIASGWTTFRLTNEGEQEHFAYIYRLPDGTNYQQFREQFFEPFGAVWQEYAKGELNREEAGEKFAEVVPEWFFTGVSPSGGPALTEPGEVAVATVNLAPGTHVMECYVKMPDGGWHTDMGMQRELTVTGEANGSTPPEADAMMTLTNYKIDVSGDLKAGRNTVAVHVVDTPEGFMQHDINLFRLDDGVSTEELVAWMDWMDLTQFRAPAPGYSLGGMEHLAAGKTGYFTVDLDPGAYAWVSEGYGAQGMVETFTVPSLPTAARDGAS